MKNARYIVKRNDEVWAWFDTILECYDYINLWNFDRGWNIVINK